MAPESIRCFNCGYIFTAEDLAALEAISLQNGEFSCHDRDCLEATIGKLNARVDLLESLLLQSGIRIEPQLSK